MADIWGISDAVSLAFHAMAYLAQNPERRASTHEISQAFGVSEHHLAKVHQRLAKAGLLETVRGPGGGVQLARAPESIPLMLVYEAIEGPLQPGHCVLGVPVCGRQTCVFGDLVRSLNKQVAEYFRSTTVADIAE